MDMTSTLPPAPTALAALTTPDLEATIRKLLSETRPASHKRPEYTQQEKDAYHQARFNGKQQPRYQPQQQSRPSPRPSYPQPGYQQPFHNKDLQSSPKEPNSIKS